MNDQEALEASLQTNLFLQKSLNLNEYEKNEFESEYREFYFRMMELYQSSFDGIAVDYPKMTTISDQFY